ncbi:MAG: hypothetical protein U1D06_12360 [Paracoccaceae bacterium]|nr:hypothetical protein [Paracoccaceae bacterium]
MADGKPANSTLAFILGGVVVALVGLGVYFWTGGKWPSDNDATITIKLPDLKN